MRPPDPLPAPVSLTAPVHRVADVREVLAYLPHRIGYRPRDCVVAVSLRVSGAVGLVARVDTDDLLDGRAPATAGALAGRLHEDRAHQVLLVVYTDADPREPDRLRAAPAGPAGRAAGLLRRALGGTPTLGPWVVTAEGYLELTCDDPTCCPPGGRPLADLTGTETGARMVLAGSVVAGTRDQVARIPPAGSRARRAAGAARLRWTQARERGGDDPAAVRRWRERSFVTWQRSLRLPDGAGTADHGRLEAALTDRVVRDAVLISLLAAEPCSVTGPVVPASPIDVRADLSEAGVPGGGPCSGECDERVDTARGTGDLGEEGPLRADPGAGAPDRGRALTGDELARAVILLGEAGPGAPTQPGTVPGGTGQGGADPCAPDRCAVDRAIRAAVAGLVVPDQGRGPDVGRLRRATRVLDRVVAHGRHGAQAPALTLLALAAWWEGDGVRADVLLDRARTDDRDYVLAGQLRRVLALGLPPGWAHAG